MIQLSSETLAILQNFAQINSNIVLKPGQNIKTISEAKNILAEADIVEDFPHDIGIYDLFEFLSIHNLVEAPHLSFDEKSIKIESTGGGCQLPNKQSVRYYCAEPSILTTTDKSIDLEDPEVSFNVSQEIISRIKKAASVLGHSEISINGDPSGISIRVFDPKDNSSNTFDFELRQESPSGRKFSLILNISNLKLIDGDYDVFVFSKGNVLVSKWVNTSRPVRYFIALEESSTFDV